MNTPYKAPVTTPTRFIGSVNTTLLNNILRQQRGTGRVHGPERGFIGCERRYLDDNRRARQSR